MFYIVMLNVRSVTFFNEVNEWIILNTYAIIVVIMLKVVIM